MLNTAANFAPGCFVHEKATVGDGSHIGAGAYVGADVHVGRRCVVQPGAVIGSDGFGFERAEDGTWHPREHPFGVVLGDDVHVGANACVDRGRHRPTWIGRGTKIDNLVHVAHNVRIGEDVIVVALAEISGSAEVGDGAWIGPGATVKQGVRIAAGALVGMGAVVIYDVAALEVVAGNPAKVKRQREPDE